MSRMAPTLRNDTMKATSPATVNRGSTREVIRRKKKASIHLDTDNEIKSRDEEDEEQQERMGTQRFLSPSVRKYLALGRAIPGT